MGAGPQGLRLDDRSRPASRGRGTKTEGEAIINTGPDGSFVIPAIAAGMLAIGTRVDEALPVRPRFPMASTSAPARRPGSEIPLEKAVRVSGVIRVKGTCDPVAGASISIGYGAPRQSDRVVSDARGRFDDLRPRGRRDDAGDLPCRRASSRSASPGPNGTRPREGRDVRPAPDRGRPRRDDQGSAGRRRGSAGGERPAQRDLGESPLWLRTDRRDGRLHAVEVPAGLKFTYQVWPDDHDTPVDAEIVKEEPLLLRAGVGSEAEPARTGTPGVSGTVVDTEGRPVEGVEVNLLVETDRSQKRETLTTDARGVYPRCRTRREGDAVPGDREPGPIRDRRQRDQ